MNIFYYYKYNITYPNYHLFILYLSDSFVVRILSGSNDLENSFRIKLLSLITFLTLDFISTLIIAQKAIPLLPFDIFCFIVSFTNVPSITGVTMEDIIVLIFPI